MPVQAGSRPLSGTSFALLLALVLMVGCRLWLAAAVPLTDTTEARYGEIARKMVETGDWITPQHDYGVPYLAKPPLAFWLSAIGITLAGPGEIGPRAPIILVTLAFLGFLFVWMRRELGQAVALTTLVVLTSSSLFFVSMGAVMTDMVLTVTIMVALLSFWRRFHGGNVAWELTLYVMLGLGLLAKGPVAVVLVAAPIVAWAARMHRVREAWRRFAWIRGAVLTLLIAAPWYAAAEMRNPGFLDYFIVGEHIKRFLIPGWSGDLYGRAHEFPRGTVLLFFLAGTLPWSVIGAYWLVVRRRQVGRNFHRHRELVWFLLAAALAPLALFALSGNVIWPYALPAIPPAVMAAAIVGVVPNAGGASVRRLGAVAALFIVTVTGLVAMNGAFIARHTQRPVIRSIRTRNSAAALPIYYWKSRYFSADYYSRGKTSSLDDAAALEGLLAARQSFVLVIGAWQRRQLPRGALQQLAAVGDLDGFLLYEPAYAVVPVAQNARS